MVDLQNPHLHLCSIYPQTKINYFKSFPNEITKNKLQHFLIEEISSKFELGKTNPNYSFIWSVMVVNHFNIT